MFYGETLGLGEKFEQALHHYRAKNLLSLPGPVGDYWRAGGNELLYGHLPIKTGETVLDGGGYEGAWTSRILVEYGAKAVVVEPVPEYIEALKTKFQNNTNVQVVPGALSDKDGRAMLTLHRDGSSVFGRGEVGTGLQIETVDVSRLLGEVGPVSVAKLNVEGSEYQVLEALASSGMMGEIRCFLIQFHNFVPDAEERRRHIRAKLSLTHQMRFEFPFVWERWDLEV